MVMKRNAMRKNLLQSIRHSFGRYIAIVAIIALGASMFVGLLMTKSDMVATGQKFMDEQNMFDLRLVSTYGWSRADLDKIRSMDGVADAEGVVYLDVIAGLDGAEDAVYRFYSMPDTINLVSLRGGRMPQSPDECLADGFHASDEILGTQVTVSSSNSEDTLDAMVYETYTVVGYVASPLYMDLSRGSTSVGNGSLSSYFYIPSEGFDVDYYSEIHVTIPGDYMIYSDTYDNAMEEAAENLEPLLTPLAKARLKQVKEDALAAYEEGLQEYEDGLKEFEEGKAEALQELEDAYNQLLDAEKQLQSSEQTIASAQQQIASGKKTLYESQKELESGRQQLEQTKQLLYGPLEESISALTASRAGVEIEVLALQAQIDEIDARISELDSIYGQQESRLQELENQLQQLNMQIGVCDLNISGLQTAINAASLFPNLNQGLIAQLQTQLQAQQDQRQMYTSQLALLQAEYDELSLQLEAPHAQRQTLLSQRQELAAQKLVPDGTLAAIDASLQAAQSSKHLLDEQFAPMEEELAAGEAQLQEAWAQVYAMEAQISQGRIQLEEGKAELEKGWEEYNEGEAAAMQEIAEAEAELADAKIKLDDAWQMIQDMNEATVFVLDRNSNAGYGSLNSSSDIVQGVSRVFPVFFLLVAALVCITTMTRMIEDERTQIGTLKALGYSNGAIISKYLIYSGSGAVVGCGLGVVVGSLAFPTILWQAYKIMLHITPGIVLQINWWLCGAVVFAYTAVMLLVTWYCCRRTLKEEPAELIRPKAPTAGKKIFMEYLPFWHRISFLNKVTIRNIFRYRQRLAMMMVGIGGCTALLVTGFGLRDTIANVVDYQFEEVTVYDMTVYFSEGRTPEQQEGFLEEVSSLAENVLFYNQTRAELDYDNQVREISLMCADDKICEFVDFHRGSKQLSMPDVDEVLLSVGIAEAMGIETGDAVTLRNTDMELLELTVSGIYDNNVDNYAIVRPETIEKQWNRTPEQQMALIQVPEDQDVYEASAEITGISGVMNVSVSEEIRTMVGSMMDALDLVIVTIVICAGLLAVIVLYNLTNINITERIREIATIKVLGFNASETAAYVFKENLSLSVMGALIGLLGGKFLLDFVMSQIKIDFVWFQARVSVQSYLLAIVLTVLSAFFVNFIFYFKLDKINMAEALKSVE